MPQTVESTSRPAPSAVADHGTNASDVASLPGPDAKPMTIATDSRAIARLPAKNTIARLPAKNAIARPPERHTSSVHVIGPMSDPRGPDQSDTHRRLGATKRSDPFPRRARGLPAAHFEGAPRQERLHQNNAHGFVPAKASRSSFPVLG